MERMSCRELEVFGMLGEQPVEKRLKLPANSTRGQDSSTRLKKLRGLVRSTTSCNTPVSAEDFSFLWIYPAITTPGSLG